VDLQDKKRSVAEKSALLDRQEELRQDADALTAIDDTLGTDLAVERSFSNDCGHPPLKAALSWNHIATGSLTCWKATGAILSQTVKSRGALLFDLGFHRFVYWVEEFLGWVLVSLFVAGMSGVMKKE